MWTDHEQILAVGSTWEETSHDEDEVVIFDFTAAESQPSVRFSGKPKATKETLILQS